MTPRKALGYFLLVAFVAVYSVAAVTLAEWLRLDGWGWQLLYYAAAGMLWVLPAIKILDWSHKADRRRA
jgi:hypothetical protein